MHTYSQINAQSVSTTVSYEKLTKSITTRVLYKKIQKQQEKERSYWELPNGNSSSSQRSRERSTFLLGAAVPNSTRKSESLVLNKNDETDDKSVIRARRNACVREIVKRMESRLRLLGNEIEEVNDKLETDDSTNSLEKQNEKGNEATNLNVANISTSKPETLDTQKEKQRITLRTAAQVPISHKTRPTYESIRNAIQNSEGILELINVDNMENKNLREAAATKSVTRDSSFILRNPSLIPLFSSTNDLASLNVSQNIVSLVNVVSKTSKTSKRSMDTVRKSKIHGKRRKSILKQGSRDNSKPSRNVSIVETTMEDSETQTYLRMKDFMQKT